MLFVDAGGDFLHGDCWVVALAMNILKRGVRLSEGLVGADVQVKGDV